MRYLEVRRHTMRIKPGEHLSQAGVDLARRVVTAQTVQTSAAFAQTFPLMIEGLKPDDTSMQPVTVLLRSPLDGKGAAYKVIGVLDTNNMVASAALYTSLAGVNPTLLSRTAK